MPMVGDVGAIGKVEIKPYLLSSEQWKISEINMIFIDDF